jgi:hypothetical protein
MFNQRCVARSVLLPLFVTPERILRLVNYSEGRLQFLEAPVKKSWAMSPRFCVNLYYTITQNWRQGQIFAVLPRLSYAGYFDRTNHPYIAALKQSRGRVQLEIVTERNRTTLAHEIRVAMTRGILLMMSNLRKY